MATVKEQAAWFLNNAATRNQDPIRPKTLAVYRQQIDSHIIPALGEMPLEVVQNKQVKDFIKSLVSKKLSAATIQLNLNLIKQIVASAVNEETGDFLHPRTWNLKFIDAPTIGTQKRPTIDSQAITDTIRKSLMPEQALFAILAGTGLRIQEALALRVGGEDGTRWLADEAKIVVQDQRDGISFGPVKTEAGNREVDLDPALNDWLCKMFSNQPDDLMFPDTEASYRARLDKHVKGGFHQLRRFRTTHLNKMSCPTGLENFWCGHAAGDVHGRYIKMGGEIETRKAEAKRIGIGFSL